MYTLIHSNKEETMTMQSAIIYPDEYLPGETDNFVSNEVIIKGLNIDIVWELLTNPHRWVDYYENCANVSYERSHLLLKARFYFETFGFPVNAEVVEYVAPSDTTIGRIAWHGWAGENDSRLDVHHAWLVENLSGNRVRILTQETQIGEPAKKLAKTTPNPMLNGHQMWLDSLVSMAKGL